MMGRSRQLRAAFVLFALSVAGSAAAQENLDKGKTPAQLYASDCAICHKSPRGLSKAGGLYGLENFLRTHYTASRESAAAIGAYLRGIDKAAPAREERATNKRKGRASVEPSLPAAKPAKSPESSTEEKAKASKTSAGKPGQSKPNDKPDKLEKPDKSN